MGARDVSHQILRHLFCFFQLCLRRPVERRGDPPGHVAPYGIPARPCDCLKRRPAIEEMAELKRQNELLRQHLQQSVSLPSTSSSPQQSSSLSPLPSSPSAAFPSALHPPLSQQSGSTLLPAPPVVFTPQQSASVQPPSQDLLSNIVQQMSSGQTAGEQPSLASFLVLGATLEPKIKAKNCEGGYVDLGALCSPTDTTVSVAMGNNGQPSISLTPVRTKPPSSIYEWLRLFRTYASIYLQAHADEAASLMTYMVAIMDMSKRHGGYAWRVYDDKFRRIRALSPTLPWHVTNWDLAMDAIHANVPGRSASPAPFRAKQRPTGKRYCFDFNGNGRCSRKPCNYIHACSNCGRQGHVSLCDHEPTPRWTCRPRYASTALSSISVHTMRGCAMRWLMASVMVFASHPTSIVPLSVPPDMPTIVRRAFTLISLTPNLIMN